MKIFPRLPGFAPDNVANRRLMDFVRAGKTIATDADRVQEADHCDLAPSERRPAVALALGFAQALFAACIEHVVPVRAKEKMRRPHARWVVARMANLRARGNRADKKRVSQSVRQMRLAMPLRIAIAVTGSGASPFPAITFRTETKREFDICKQLAGDAAMFLRVVLWEKWQAAQQATAKFLGLPFWHRPQYAAGGL